MWLVGTLEFPTFAWPIFHSVYMFTLMILSAPFCIPLLLKTTNAEEVMHAKFYKACGHDHTFLEGMNALYALAAYFVCLFWAATCWSAIL